MSSLRLAHASNKLEVEWNKHPPHYRVITNDSRSRGYNTEEAAMRAAKRLCKQMGITLEKDRYGPQESD